MVDAQTISVVFAGMSVGIAAIYYALTLRRAEKDRQTIIETRQGARCVHYMGSHAVILLLIHLASMSRCTANVRAR